MQYLNLQRRLFQEDPAQRFSRVFKAKPDLWREVWRRYVLLKYTEAEAHEYLMLITRVPVRKEQFLRWLKRTEVYNKAQVALKAGAIHVHPNYFGKLSYFVEKEISKNDKICHQTQTKLININ